MSILFSHGIEFTITYKTSLSSIAPPYHCPPPLTPFNAVSLFNFGGKKLPELMRGLGKGIREFQDAKNEVKDQINKELDDTKK